MGNDAPSDPAFEAILTVVEAAIQSIDTFEDTDPAFDTMVITTPSSEPALSFMRYSLSRAMSRFGKDDPPDT